MITVGSYFLLYTTRDLRIGVDSLFFYISDLTCALYIDSKAILYDFFICVDGRLVAIIDIWIFESGDDFYDFLIFISWLIPDGRHSIVSIAHIDRSKIFPQNLFF